MVCACLRAAEALTEAQALGESRAYCLNTKALTVPSGLSISKKTKRRQIFKMKAVIAMFAHCSYQP
jgi:hypothetical protein